MFYIEDIDTDDIITVSDTLKNAIELCKLYPNSLVSDESEEIYFTNCEE